MWHIIIQVGYKTGGSRVIRAESDDTDFDYWESYYSNHYDYPDVAYATVTNAFYIKGD